VIVTTLYLSIVIICLYSFCVISNENFSIKYFTILVNFHTFYLDIPILMQYFRGKFPFLSVAQVNELKILEIIFFSKHFFLLWPFGRGRQEQYSILFDIFLGRCSRVRAAQEMSAMFDLPRSISYIN